MSILLFWGLGGILAGISEEGNKLYRQAKYRAKRRATEHYWFA